MNHIIRTLSAALLLLLPTAVLRAQNTVTAEATTVTEGQEWTLDVSLTNSTEYVTFQADIAVPEGVTLKAGSFTPAARLNDHTVTATTLSNGVIRIIAHNNFNTTFLGHSGTLFTLTLTAASTLTASDAKIVFRNMRFTDTDLQEELLTAFIVELPMPDDLTGIVAPGRAAASTVSTTRIYDLQGRTIATPKRAGIYIINGKKVCIR